MHLAAASLASPYPYSSLDQPMFLNAIVPKSLAFAAVWAIVFSGCTTPVYSMKQVRESAEFGHYTQAKQRLQHCAQNHQSADSAYCNQYLRQLNKQLSMGQRLDHAFWQAEQETKYQQLRESHDPWDKFLLFSALSTGRTQPAFDNEAESVAELAFEGLGECAKTADSACMALYGDMILRGSDALAPEGKAEARARAIYWLKLAARYGNDLARASLISIAEEVPTPDLAMERLQREANQIAIDARRDQAARDYQMLGELQRQSQQAVWRNVFPKYVNCTSSSIGSQTYTRCW